MNYLEAQKIQNLENQVKKYSLGLRKVYRTSTEAIKELVEKGYSFEESESMVMEILQESVTELKAGEYSMVIQVLKMTFELKK